LDLFGLCGATPVESGASGACDVSYVMAGVRNPTGRDGTPRLLQALAGDRPVIVDEAYAQLRFDGREQARVLDRARERVWLVGTVSKILCPGLRIGWLVPPRRCVAAALERKQASDLQTGSLVQAVLARALERFDLDAHAVRVREAYRVRAAMMVEALRRYAPSWAFHEPEGGFSIYVTTPEPGDENALLAAAIDGGVSFDPGGIFRAARGADDVLRFRLCYSAANPGDIAEGVRRIADAWRRFTAAGCDRGARAAREWYRPASRTG
jgi:2-aminoadipate transaminase